MAVIKVPKTPKKAFNKQRAASELLKAQIHHLEWATRPASQRKPDTLKEKPVRTEAEAAARAERLLEKLRAQHNAPIPPAEGAAQPPQRPKRVRRGKTAAKRSSKRATRSRRKR